MKIPSMNSMSPLEIILTVIFLVYIIYPVSTPQSIAPYVNSNLGMALIIIFTFYMVFYVNKVLGIMTIVVAYELLRRSSNVTQDNQKLPIITTTSSQRKKDAVMKQMNEPKEVSLEEEIIQKNVPVGKSAPLEQYTNSTFKPVQDKIAGASIV